MVLSAGSLGQGGVLTAGSELRTLREKVLPSEFFQIQVLNWGAAALLGATFT